MLQWGDHEVIGAASRRSDGPGNPLPGQGFSVGSAYRYAKRVDRAAASQARSAGNPHGGARHGSAVTSAS